jgi:hypothetical protein
VCICADRCLLTHIIARMLELVLPILVIVLSFIEVAHRGRYNQTFLQKGWRREGNRNKHEESFASAV